MTCLLTIFKAPISAIESSREFTIAAAEAVTKKSLTDLLTSVDESEFGESIHLPSLCL